MELSLCPAKSSGSTNRVGNTVRSKNGMDIVSLLLPCGVINSKRCSVIIRPRTCWDTARASIRGKYNIRITRPLKCEHVGDKQVTMLEVF